MRIVKILLIMFVLVGCNLPGLSGNTDNNDIVIASGSTSERQIVAEIIKQMIEHYDPKINVDILSNLGSSILNHQAMLRNDANISAVMYTGTSITGELNLKPILDPSIAYTTVVKEYYSEFDLVWFPSFGFANTYSFMVTEDFASKHSLSKVSDLKTISEQLTAGVDTSWMDREGDGYSDFKEIYGFDFNQVLAMDVGLVYNAVSNDEVDVVLGYSTDGRIDSYNLVILEDDLNLFPPYDASLVVSKRLLNEVENLEEILLKLEGSINQNTMQELNQLSDGNQIEPYKIAKTYLEKNNYFENIDPKPLMDRIEYQEMSEKND